MSSVLDSSALVAYLKQEQGTATVAAVLPGALLSTVSVAESIAVLLRLGTPLDRARKSIELSQVRIVDFNAALAEATGALIARTRHVGLSFGDCACLALAARENLPALTADRAWRGLEIGVEIQFIR